ncbi:MAG: hypothetical protein ACT4N2_05815 [Hyphomicrobium sp.]
MELPAIEELHHSISGFVPFVDDFTLLAALLLIVAMVWIGCIRRRQKARRRMRLVERLDRLRQQ